MPYLRDTTHDYTEPHLPKFQISVLALMCAMCSISGTGNLRPNTGTDITRDKRAY
jgi:hypothetical protein